MKLTVQENTATCRLSAATGRIVLLENQLVVAMRKISWLES